MIAQMVERRTVDVKKNSVGRVFESLSRDLYFNLYIAGDVAQMVECLLSMRKVVGSMPTVSIMVAWSSGYDVSFTPKRSPVQSRP